MKDPIAKQTSLLQGDQPVQIHAAQLSALQKMDIEIYQMVSAIKIGAVGGMLLKGRDHNGVALLYLKALVIANNDTTPLGKIFDLDLRMPHGLCPQATLIKASLYGKGIIGKAQFFILYVTVIFHGRSSFRVDLPLL
jgi:hypothetical protein